TSGENSAMFNPAAQSYFWCDTAGVNGFDSIYRAHRGADGWTSDAFGPTAAEATQADGQQITPDGYQVLQVGWGLQADQGGSLAIAPPGADPAQNASSSIWLRHPDGTYNLIGEGTIPSDPDTDGYHNGFADSTSVISDWISPGATHQIFESAVRLTADAPP